MMQISVYCPIGNVKVFNCIDSQLRMLGVLKVLQPFFFCLNFLNGQFCGVFGVERQCFRKCIQYGLFRTGNAGNIKIICGFLQLSIRIAIALQRKQIPVREIWVDPKGLQQRLAPLRSVGYMPDIIQNRGCLLIHT